MKTILVTCLLIISTLSSSSWAEGYDAEKIYKALNIKEVNANPEIVGSMLLVKSVGGLECSKSRVVYPNAPTIYSCTLESTSSNLAVSFWRSSCNH